MGWVQEKTGSNSWASESGHSSEWLKEGSPEQATITAREYAQQAENSAFFAVQAKEEATAVRDAVLSSKMAVEAAKEQAVQASETASASSAEVDRYMEEAKATLEEAVALVPSVRVETTEIGVHVIAKDSTGETVAEVLNGKDGEDGYTPVKGVDYSDGKDGYTPRAGVDYFTEEDIATMVNAVVDRVVTETWVFTLTDGTVIEKEICAR